MNQQELDTPGLWPMYRRDARLSGHQPLPGAIKRPRVAWRHYLGGAIFDARIVDVAGRRLMLLIYGGCVVAHGVDGAIIWSSSPLGIDSIIGVEDVDRDGRVEIVATDGKSIYLLDASTGALLWREYVGPPFSTGFFHTGALLHHFPQVGPGMQLVVGLISSRDVLLFDFSPGAEHAERRHILWMDDFFHPTVLVADLDGDGVDELIVTKYCAIYTFDPVTGEMKDECRWETGGVARRNYGLFQVVDVDGDGNLDLVVYSTLVSRHVAVIANAGGGRLAPRWDRFLEHAYPHDEKELRYTFNSTVDLDGDGRLEIAISTYNDVEEGRWHLEILDALTGDALDRIPDLYLRGVQRIADDTVIFASVERERVPSESGTLVALVWSREGARERWRMEGGSFIGRFRGVGTTETIMRPEFPPADEIWCELIDGALTIPLRLDGGALALLRVASDAWRVEPVPCAEGCVAILAIADLDDDGRTEILISAASGIVTALRADGSTLCAFQVGIRSRYGALYFASKVPLTPVVFVDGNERYCAVPDAGTKLHLLTWDGGASVPTTTATFEGRGRIGPEEAHHSVIAHRIDGKSVVLSGAVGDGEAALRAHDVDGVEVARWSVPGLPAAPRVPWGRTGIHDFLPVHIGGRERMIISGYRSVSMNSEHTWCLDAAGGEVMWKRRYVADEIEGSGEISEEGRGFGPWNAMTIAGRDRNELWFLAKDTMCQIDPESGALVHRPWQLRPYNTADLRRRAMTMDDFSAYGSLAPIDVDGDGEEELLFQANYGGFGVMDRRHAMRWWRSAPLSSLTGGMAGVADVDGDGVPEIGIGYADGAFVCYRADTGEEKWRLHLGSVPSDVITCDIDGDGAIEFVIATRGGDLIAAGPSRNGSPIIKWRMRFPSGLGPPVAADLDGDGRSEILVVCGDGYLYGIGAEE